MRKYLVATFIVAALAFFVALFKPVGPDTYFFDQRLFLDAQDNRVERVEYASDYSRVHLTTGERYYVLSSTELRDRLRAPGLAHIPLEERGDFTSLFWATVVLLISGALMALAIMGLIWDFFRNRSRQVAPEPEA